MNRREAVKLVAGVGAGVLKGAAAFGQTPSTTRYPDIPNWQTELKRLAPNVYAYTQASGPGVNNASLSNAGIIVGNDLLAIDTLGPPIHAKAFHAIAKQTFGKQFGRVVNTHHHRDHTNGNCFFLPAEIVAHEYCRLATIEQGIPEHPYDDRPQWQEDMDELKLAPATTTYTDRLNYRYGDTIVELMHPGPAHTFGDTLVYIPQHKILFAGDIAFYYVTPAGHNGYLSKWLETIDRIMAMDVETIVPGHGPIGGRKELSETRSYMDLLIRETKKRHAARMRPGLAAADLDMGRFAKWTNPERNVWNVVRLYAELNGTLKPEQDLDAQNQAVEEYNSIIRSRPQ